MKQKLSLTLGIIVLLIIGLVTSPAKAANPTLQAILDAIAALQASVNSQGTAIGALQSSVDDLTAIQGDMTTAWYQILPSAERFLLVMGDAAVLDRETGLVWERSPSSTTPRSGWFLAQVRCNNLATGGRKGWRLPTVQELTSLVDPSVGISGPRLPSGHPFTNVQSDPYWSGTADSRYATGAWAVDFSNGVVGAVDKSLDNFDVFVWCVRGGQGVDSQ